MDFYERPHLRPDLEVLPDGADGPAVYDPARRELFELAAADLPVLRLLDGTRSPQEIARLARRPLQDVLDLLDDLADTMLLVDPEQEAALAAWRRRHEDEDRRLAPILDTCPADGLAGRPIHVVDDARHTCLRCGACCHYAVPLTSEERRHLAQVKWPEGVVPEGGGLFRLQPGLQWGRWEETIATRSDPTRCVFLGADNLCQVQPVLGPAAKPFPCRLFPLAYPVAGPERVIVSLTFECPHLYRTYETGEPLAGRREELAALVAEMEEVYTLPEEISLDGERTLDLAAYLAWEGALLEGPAAPATDPAWFLEAVQSRWEEIAPGERRVVPSLAELAELARALGQAVREHRAVVLDSPEGEEGVAAAVHVLEGLADRPEVAWSDVRWAEDAAADRFLGRFVRHFIEGKQMLFYPCLWAGLRALTVILLLARRDALALERAAGRTQVSLAALNRALARWGRLLDIRPFRLAFLREVS